MTKDIFKRLGAGRPLQAEGADRSLRRRIADRKAFLQDILAAGPVAATLVEQRGAAHGFSKIQIRYARRQMKIISFKGPGENGGWFWAFGHDNRAIPAQSNGLGYLKETKETGIPVAGDLAG